MDQIPIIVEDKFTQPQLIGRGFVWGVNFSLTTPLHGGGFIIQRVDRHRSRYLLGREQKDPVKTYWEAWPVPPGKCLPLGSFTAANTFPVIKEWLRATGVAAAQLRMNRNDWFALQYEAADQKGSVTMTGLTRFYELSPSRLRKTFKVGAVKLAGDLPSSDSAPPFWKDAGAYHAIEFEWDRRGKEKYFKLESVILPYRELRKGLPSKKDKCWRTHQTARPQRRIRRYCVLECSKPVRRVAELISGRV